jgi:phosphatidylglycerol lysyltransferase-like protein
VLLLGGAVLHLLKGLDLEVALLESFLGGLLLGKADRFSAHADPNERRLVLRPAVAVVVLTLIVGELDLLTNRHNVHGILTASSVLWEVANLAVGLPSPLVLDGRFGRFFPITILVMFVVGAGLVVLRLLAPALTRGHRDRHAPAFLTDFLVVEAAMRLRELGLRRLSLNSSFLRVVLAVGGEPTAPLGLRLQRWTLRRLSSRFQIETLYRFNKKFSPTWLPRYLAVEAIEDLPRVVLSALRLEGLLAPPRRPHRQEPLDHDHSAPDDRTRRTRTP